MAKNKLLAMNFIRKAMQTYRTSLNEIPSFVGKMTEDEHFKIFMKGSRLRVGFDKQNVIDITFHNYIDETVETIPLTNAVREHYDYPVESRTYGIGLFLVAMSASGWHVIKDSVSDQENHVSTKLYNEKTQLTAECHFSLSTFNLLLKENTTPTFFSDLYPEID